MTLARDSDFVKLCLEIPHDIEHVQVYIHKMAIRIGDAEFDAKISFADREEVPRLLGRMGIFQKFQVCFDEKTLMVHFIKN